MARKTRKTVRTFNDAGNLFAFDGGCTADSLAAWQDAKAQLSGNWAPILIVGSPDYTVTYQGRRKSDVPTSKAHVVSIVFKDTTPVLPALAGDEPFRTFAADGFSWGYSGEGPRGLATLLTDLASTFGYVPESSLDALRVAVANYIAAQGMDTPWSLSVDQLFKSAQVG